jgi:hypothetical protein
MRASLGRRPSAGYLVQVIERSRHRVDETNMALRRMPRRAAAIAALAMLALPGVAEARMDRFAPAADVTVSFRIRGATTGVLVRLARNHVTLVRNSRGTLALRDRYGRVRRIPGRRPGRITVTLSTTPRVARLSIGHAAKSLSGRFVTENAVLVRPGRAVAALQIRTSPSEARLSAPSGARAPATTSAPATATARLFAATSVWNAPLAADAPIDPASTALVKTLRDAVAADRAAHRGPWISVSGTSPLYVVPANQPTVRVQLDPGSWKQSLQQAFAAVPIPANAVPAAGADAHLTVWQPSTDRLWEFFKARRLADGWHANYGGAMSATSRSPGYYDTASWPGLSQTWWGAAATSLPVIAGTMMLSELRGGVIPHALALNIPWAKAGVYSLPAQRTDGRLTDANAIPEGARFRIDPRVDLGKLNLPPLTRMMAVAAQRYGMIVRDQTGWAVSFFAENPAQYGGVNPYTAPGGLYRGPNPEAVMAAFPWQYVQLVRMDLRAQ